MIFQTDSEHPEDRREQELHRRVERQHQSRQDRDLTGTGDIAQQRRKDGEYQPNADRIECNRGKDDDQGLVQQVPPRTN
jgi:hypothetical protein